MVADALVRGASARPKWQDYKTMDFRYGEGIGGRAFKNNTGQLYTQQPQSPRGKPPDYYLRIPSHHRQHAVMLCLPLQNPEFSSQVYGVMCCGGYSRDSKFWQIMNEAKEDQEQRLQKVQQRMNAVCLERLHKIFDI